MPRKPSKYVTRESYDHLKAERDLLGLGLHLLALELPEWSTYKTHEGLRYRFSLFRPTAAHGGIVIVKTAATDPKVLGDHVTVHYLDTILAELSRGDRFNQWAPFVSELTQINEARYRANRPKGE